MKSADAIFPNRRDPSNLPCNGRRFTFRIPVRIRVQKRSKQRKRGEREKRKKKNEGKRGSWEVAITNQTKRKKGRLSIEAAFFCDRVFVSLVGFSFFFSRHVSFLDGAFYSIGSRFVGHVRDLNYREDRERSPNRTRPRPGTLLGSHDWCPLDTCVKIRRAREGREKTETKREDWGWWGKGKRRKIAKVVKK